MFLLNSTFFKLLVLLIAHLQTGHSQNNSFLSAATVSATAIHQRRDKVRQVSEKKCSAFTMIAFFLYTDDATCVGWVRSICLGISRT